MPKTKTPEPDAFLKKLAERRQDKLEGKTPAIDRLLFKRNWADEMELEGAEVMEIATLVEDLKKLRDILQAKIPITWAVGTNQEVEIDDSLCDGFELRYIGGANFLSLKDCLGSSGVGFTFGRLMNQVYDAFSDEEDGDV